MFLLYGQVDVVTTGFSAWLGGLQIEVVGLAGGFYDIRGFF